MTRNKLAIAATSALIGFGALAGTAALADSHTANGGSAQELQQFLSQNPSVASAVAAVEAKTGGKVTGAEFVDANAGAAATVEFEVKTANGMDQTVLYTMADGSMNARADDSNHDGKGMSEDDSRDNGDNGAEAGSEQNDDHQGGQDDGESDDGDEGSDDGESGSSNN